MAISGRTHTHTHGTISVYVRALRSFRLCVYVFVAHTPRCAQPKATARHECEATYKSGCHAQSSPHSCQDARWHQPSWQPQGQRSSSSSSAGRARSLPVGEAQRLVSSGCRMDLVCHVCVASPACTACLMSTKGQHGGTTRM